MRDVVVRSGEALRQQVEQGLRELEQVRAEIRSSVPATGVDLERWAELERRSCIAALVARKATPASRRTVHDTVAALRAFSAALPRPPAMN